MEQKIHKLELDITTHGEKIGNIVQRLDSQALDAKERHEKLESMIAKLPDEDKIYRMFSEENKQTAYGLTGRINKIEGNQKYIVGLGAGFGIAIEYLLNVFK